MESFMTSTTVLIPPVIELAVVGPSGSGTSALMHILGCPDVPTSGEYWLAGYEVNGRTAVDLADLRARQVGFVFRRSNLHPSRSARRNVEEPLKRARVSRAKRRVR